MNYITRILEGRQGGSSFARRECDESVTRLKKSYGFRNNSCKSHRTYDIIFAKVIGLLQINH